jgi:nucleotide-binding universal stress UspA family protein
VRIGEYQHEPARNEVTMQRIVVGVDGTPASHQALEWALDEASLHHAVVELVTVYTYLGISSAAAALPHVPIEQQHDTAQRLSRESLAAVHEQRPDLCTVVTRQQLIEDATAEHALRAAADSADLLVVGARSHGRVATALLQSTSATCAHRATAPVAVIHARPGEQRPMRSAEAGRIVVGIDDSPVSATALRWAADEASRRNVQLIVVTAWLSQFIGEPNMALPIGERRALRRKEHRLARQRAELTVRDCLGEQAVPVKIRSRYGFPADVLDVEARDDDLLVIGCRGHSALRRALVGSTTTDLLQRRRGPLVVVHTRSPHRRGMVSLGELSTHS